MTTDASPHTIPSIVSTERNRLRISACQPCEMSSLRNMGCCVRYKEHLELRAQSPKPDSLINPYVARACVHCDLRPTAAYLSPDHLARVFYPALHGRRHRRTHHDAARAGRDRKSTRLNSSHVE